MDVEDLLKVVLVLVILWVGLEIITEVLQFVFGPFLTLLRPVLGIIIIVLIVLWLLDRI